MVHWSKNREWVRRLNREPDFSSLLDLPTLETPRLLLRKIRMEDAAGLFACLSDPAVTGPMHHSTVQSREELESKIREYLAEYEEGLCARWCAVHKEDGHVVGSVLLYTVGHPARAACGSVVNRADWRHGYATEMLSAALAFGFDTLGLYRIEADHFLENAESGRVMERCGMRCEGDSPGFYWEHGAPRCVRHYAITRPDWEAMG